MHFNQLSSSLFIFQIIIMRESADKPINNFPSKAIIVQQNVESVHNSARGSQKENEYSSSDIQESSVRLIHQNLNSQEVLAILNKYQPLSNIDMSLINKSEFLKLKRYKQCIFYGQIQNGKRNGLGIMIYYNGRVYEGEWQNDFKQGKGFQKFVNNAKYEGCYVQGKPDGLGTYVWPNGELYQGEWLNGLKHGSGMWRGSRGDSYIGEWKYGIADGYGVHTWVNGDRYEGQFKECLKHGEGTQKFGNGDVYIGSYVNGKPTGYGQYYWGNGTFFKGSFNNGLRHGNGSWKKGPGMTDKYDGQYANDKKSGYGVFTWASGNVYKGFYFDDVRHGYGQMYWNDGSCYKGMWQKGIQHGEGQITLPGEKPKKGIFQENVLISIIHQDQNNQNNHQKYLTHKKFNSNVQSQLRPNQSQIYNNRYQPPEEQQEPSKYMYHNLKIVHRLNQRINNRSSSQNIPDMPAQHHNNFSQPKKSSAQKIIGLKQSKSQSHSQNSQKLFLPNNRNRYYLKAPHTNPMIRQSILVKNRKNIYPNISQGNLINKIQKQKLPHSSFYLHQISKYTRPLTQNINININSISNLINKSNTNFIQQQNNTNNSNINNKPIKYSNNNKKIGTTSAIPTLILDQKNHAKYRSHRIQYKGNNNNKNKRYSNNNNNNINNNRQQLREFVDSRLSGQHKMVWRSYKQ